MCLMTQNLKIYISKLFKKLFFDGERAACHYYVTMVITIFVHVNVKVCWGKTCFGILVQLLGINYLWL